MPAEQQPPAVDAHSSALWERVAAMAAGIAPGQLTPARRRALMREASPLMLAASGPAPARRQNLAIELPGRSLPARLYRPLAPRSGAGAADVLLVFFHGGGWVLGDLDTHDDACAVLAQGLGCSLLSVAYRLAPEFPFPAPCDDAAEAYAWAAGRLHDWDCTRIAVAGDSAGGQLAAHAMFASPAVPTAAALLLYPVTDMDFGNASYRNKQTGAGLLASAMPWFWQQFLGTQEPSDDPRAVPMRQRWQRRPPPTVVSLAWHDPLHDEGVAYAGLLRRAGGEVRLLDAPDMLHGFLRQCSVNAAARRHLELAMAQLLECLALRS